MFQVRVLQPSTGAFKMVGPIRNTIKELESIERQVCREVDLPGKKKLFVSTVAV